MRNQVSSRNLVSKCPSDFVTVHNPLYSNGTYLSEFSKCRSG